MTSLQCYCPNHTPPKSLIHPTSPHAHPLAEQRWIAAWYLLFPSRRVSEHQADEPTSADQLSREDEAQTDTQVTRGDQDNINRFSTLHQKQGLLKEELNQKRQEKEYLDDVSTELELADEDDIIPYKIGDSFLHLPLEDVQGLLEKSAQAVTKEIEELEEKIEKNDEVMKGLKVKLYAKFGKAINLEA